MPDLLRSTAPIRLPLAALLLTALLGLAACNSDKDKKAPADTALDDASLPMSPAPGDLLPEKLPGFTLEISPAAPTNPSLRDNLVAFARPTGQTEGDPPITLSLGRIDGPSIHGKFAELFQGFEMPVRGLTRGVRSTVIRSRAVQVGDVTDPAGYGDTHAHSILWFRYYRDVPVMVFASDEATGRRFIDALCQHWESMKSASAGK